MKLFFLPLLLFAGIQLPAQNSIFLSAGQIEFEKKVNLYDQMQEDDESWSDLMKKTMPRFKTSYFDLLFAGSKTLYRPGRNNPENDKIEFAAQVADNNTIFSDLQEEKCTSQKKVFEQVFLVQDSARVIHWKLTNETRIIAGFECRRANAIIMDSVYVVAFYTEEITTPGGPESFSGLPGMILGVALPHQHITWFATKVQTTTVTAADLPIPAKGKKTNNKQLRETLAETFKDWEKRGRRYLLLIMI